MGEEDDNVHDLRRARLAAAAKTQAAEAAAQAKVRKALLEEKLAAEDEFRRKRAFLHKKICADPNCGHTWIQHDKFACAGGAPFQCYCAGWTRAKGDSV